MAPLKLPCLKYQSPTSIHFAALCGSQGWNSLNSLSSAPGCFSSPEGGATSISVCLLELSSGAILSERGGALRLSFGGGADLSTGTRVMGPSSWPCATATPVRPRQSIAKITACSRTLIFYSNPKRTPGTRSPDSGVRTRNPTATLSHL